MEIKLSSGYTVNMKPFVDRKTAREYRAALLKDAEIRTVKQKNPAGREVDVEKYVYNPIQFDLANDVLVRGMVKEMYSPDGKAAPLLDETFDLMNDEDFDLLLSAANKIFYKRDSEKKSS